MAGQQLRPPMEARVPATPSEAGSPFPLLEQFPGAVLTLDAAGRIVYLNGIAELRLDAVRSELTGRDLFREVLPQLEVEGWGERFRMGMAAGRVSLACEATAMRHDGPAQLGLGIRSYQQDGARGAFVLIEDRSAVALADERRRRAERLAAVGELATGVAHEINNPLASIRGFAQLLASDLKTPEHSQAVEIISHECTRVARIIDNLLSFADQQRSSARGTLNLTELVERMLDLRQYAMETSGIEIQRDLDPALSPLLGERSGLQRAVLALLTRAEETLGRRVDGRRLVVRTRESTDGVVLYVIDNGPGIPRERLKTLFTVPDPGEPVGGIGLCGAHAVVREHGGHLWADSVEGEGTAFYIRLPRWEPEPAAELTPVPLPAPAPAAEAPKPSLRSVSTRSLRVLVADDEATLRLAIALFLGRHGHEVVQAADAYEALQLASQRTFDVVLADARMPGDGITLLQKLEGMPELEGRTILMTGAHPSTGGDAAPGRPFLSKPFDMTEVLHLVEAVGR